MTSAANNRTVASSTTATSTSSSDVPIPGSSTTSPASSPPSTSSSRRGSASESSASSTPNVPRRSSNTDYAQAINDVTTLSSPSRNPPAPGAVDHGPSHVVSPTFGSGSEGEPQNDILWAKVRRWLHIRTWWKGAIAVVTLVIGVIGLVYSAYRSYNLARWTAAKDFHEQCQSEKVSLLSIRMVGLGCR